MKTIKIILITLIFVSCESTTIEDCNCGDVIATSNTQDWHYYITVVNDCTNNSKEFEVDKIDYGYYYEELESLNSVQYCSDDNW